MKRIFSILFTLVLVVSFSLIPSALVGASPGPGLIGLWHLDEGSAATTVSDSSGNGNTGTIYGATPGVAGKFGNALSFDGNDYVEVPDSSTLEPSSITVECWVKSSTVKSYQYIVAKYYTGSYASYGLYTGSSKGLFFYVSDGGYALSNDAGTGVWDGAWHHVAGTYDGSTLRLYVDGSEVGTGKSVTKTIGYNAGKLYIGSYSAGYYFTGEIDEVRVWDEARAPNPYGEITSPDEDEVIFGSADFEALYYDDDPGIVQWAVRQGTCAAATNTVLGNVDGHTDPYSWDGYSFQATADTSSWTPDWYCFVFNPKEEGGEQDIRLTRQFWVGSLGDLDPPDDYNPVGTNHTVSVSISVPVAGVEIMFEVNGNNTASGSATTDEDGVASFTYSGANGGMDTITAYIDQNDNDTYDISEPSTTTTKYWLEHYVTGGGIIVEGMGKSAAKITFGGNVGFDLDGNPLGQWQTNFHNVNNDALDKGQFHSTEIISIDFVDFPALPDPSPPEADVNYVRFDALGKFNGEDGWRIRVNATDFGEGNKTEPDEIRIRLWAPGSNQAIYDSYDHGGDWQGDFPDESFHVRTDLDGGNIQIHPPDIPVM